jgi:hypothetical protein
LQILNLSQLRFSCRSEYGSEFEYDAPAKILEKARHGLAEFDDQQLIVVSQVLANDINIGYEEITNILVKLFIPQPLLFWFFFLLSSFGLSCDQVVK